jgi:flagellar hook assembly protein FlgD
MIGRYILSYNTQIFSTSTETTFLQWDGRDVNGAKLKQGIYPYTLIVTDNLGQQSIIRQKLVLGY